MNTLIFSSPLVLSSGIMTISTRYYILRGALPYFLTLINGDYGYVLYVRVVWWIRTDKWYVSPTTHQLYIVPLLADYLSLSLSINTFTYTINNYCTDS